jgi:signal transduction histidine kinase
MANLSVAYKSLAIPDFMTALVHEVKNPVTNINLSLVMLKLPLEEVDKKAYLDIISRSTIRINSIVDQLLLYHGSDEVTLKSQSVHQLIDTVLALAADSIELKKVTVVKDYAYNDYKLCVDSPKMIVALNNIIINAINAMAYGKGELLISTKAVDGNLLMHITDNGCGISKHNLKHIFKPNFSVNDNGLGLGLTAALYILKVNKISISVSSTLGEGTCVTLLFKNMVVVK